MEFTVKVNVLELLAQPKVEPVIEIIWPFNKFEVVKVAVGERLPCGIPLMKNW